DVLELAAGREAYPLAIGREEGSVAALRGRERRGLRLIERADGELQFAAGAARGVGDTGSVGRQDDRDVGREHGVGSQVKIDVHQRGRWRLFPEVDKAEG